MRIGSLCFATDSGLGVLAKSFYDNGIIDEVLIIEHAHYPTHYEWYPSAKAMPIRPFDFTTAARFCESVDVVLFYETAFDWRLLDVCRMVKTKTVLMPMYECHPRDLKWEPDLYICPSLLDLQYFPNGIFLPVPVNVPWRQRDKAEVFVHNAGHLGLRNRNGTGVLLDAMKHVKSPIKLILRSQKVLPWKASDPRIELRVGNFPRESLWEEGDAFIFPDAFNGLSLPLQEAYASGMLVIATDRFPANSWLPTEPLIPVDHYVRSCVSGRCLEFDEAVVKPEDVAQEIDEWYGRSISLFSLSGKDWAQKNSWAVLGPRYKEVLERLYNG